MEPRRTGVVFQVSSPICGGLCTLIRIVHARDFSHRLLFGAFGGPKSAREIGVGCGVGRAGGRAKLYYHPLSLARKVLRRDVDGRAARAAVAGETEKFWGGRPRERRVPGNTQRPNSRDPG